MYICYCRILQVNADDEMKTSKSLNELHTLEEILEETTFSNGSLDLDEVKGHLPHLKPGTVVLATGVNCQGSNRALIEQKLNVRYSIQTKFNKLYLV